MPLNKKILSFIILSALLIASFPSLALADVYTDINKGLTPFGRTFGQSQNPLNIVVGIVKTVLGFLGIIFVALVIYAGFLWMTSAGNEEKIKKAKSILTNSIIGLAIILGAWVITRFVVCTITSSVTPEEQQWFWTCAF